nr:immunoglobulin heavy chain junction region [Macaca mulatta]MOW75336.1 immunoglobulin heavy chain junction region [Macaca mulatta]MOW75922.1 immunoglobulin heavy chain junction region [Macaca mulatta]MOW76169.1 immunoglobulin heavy chain junction region [Macaca mulatta]MOW78373.1 immunoglobulin heavy chain junction region [Macaca mulatta]
CARVWGFTAYISPW